MRGIPDIGWCGVALVVLVINGYGEETGWRGFAWPDLRQRHSFRFAALRLGLLWSLWRAPLFWLDTGFRDFAVPAIPGLVFGLTCGAVVLGWLYDRTASILVVALWHTMLNMATATNATEPAAAFVSIAVMVWAFWILRHDEGADQGGGTTDSQAQTHQPA